MASSDQQKIHLNKFLCEGADGITRCWWCGDHAEYVRYHDEEWGRPVADDFRLFEKVCLESFQSGLSWLTILVKRENFRAAFADFDFHIVAKFTEQEVKRLLADEGIVRHQGKIRAAINNAQRALELVAEYGSLAAYFWKWEPSTREPEAGKTASEHQIPSITQTSINLSKDLKKRGWKFFGPTTCYAFMQAMGLVNDHLEGCKMKSEVELMRKRFALPQ